MTVLPTLRKKILRGYLLILALFAASGLTLLVSSIFSATAMTPRLIHSNYDSIEAARKMSLAWNSLMQNPAAETRTEFEQRLKFATSNITEVGEGAVIEKIKNRWKIYLSDTASGRQDTQSMIALLEELTHINEEAMFRLVKESFQLRRNTLMATALVFLAALALTVWIADGMATRLASPLKEAAEVLRDRPNPQEKLKLPYAHSLELKILLDELSRLWQRTGQVDRLKVEEILTQRNKLQEILASVEDAVLVVNNSGAVTHMSDRMGELLGISTDAASGKPWQDLPLLNNNYLILRKHFSDTHIDGEAFELILNGTTRIFAGRRRTAAGPGGAVAATIYLLHDITETRHHEQLKVEFMAVLSHELKTPLQSLGTAVELLMAKKQEWGAREQGLIETIDEDVTRIRSVAQDFVQIGSLTGGAIRLRLEKVNLAAALPQWLKPFDLLAKERGIRLTFALEGSNPMYAQIDAAKFPWAISNLVSNAIRIAPQNTEINVLLTDRNDAIEVRVIDQGPGISDEVQKHMFEPFFQGNDPGVSKGIMGMGLSIAKDIAEAHGGQVSYARNRPCGSLFRITLPLES